MLFAADALVTGTSADTGPGWVETDAETIVALGHGTPPGRPDRTSAILAPGFVDVHCHGGGGASFDEASDAATLTALAAHRARGTTTTVASLVTASIDDLVRQVDHLASWVERGELAGVHIEGPWLAPGKKGAHEASLLASPRAADVAQVLEAGRGTIRQVTLAPELAGASEAIATLTTAGVTVAIGHTCADFALTRRAINEGARGATHLFNAMPALDHRNPGPVLALLADDRVTCELIADGVHVDLALVSWLLTSYPGRIALITDAMAAAGCPDGPYTLGSLDVEVTSGVARLVSNGAIAGSTLFLGRAVELASSAGVPTATTLNAATSTPARYLGLDAGVLEVGKPADLVMLDAARHVTGVVRHGRVLDETGR